MAQLEWRRFFPPTVEVKETEELGRGLYASEEIPRGTEVLRSEPLVHVLNTNDVEKYCSYCLVPREIRDPLGETTQRTLMKCAKCNFVSYCGKECQTKDWFLHQRECKVLTKVKAIHEPSWWTCPHDYTAHVRLLIRMHKRTVEQCTSHEIDLLCLNSTGIQSQLAMRDLKMKIGIRVKEEELLRLNCKIVFNSFSILDHMSARIGCGIYTGPSLLNHACDPNCEPINDGQTLILRAIKTIQPGEQLWISYIPLLATYQQRQAKLWKSYMFHCKCNRCVGECKQDSPYHIMYATTGDIPEEGKEKMMEEGFSIINKKHEMDDIYANRQIIHECQQFLEKYKEVLHPANILNIQISDAMRGAYLRLRIDHFKVYEATKRVCDAYRYCPFKDCFYDYGMQLLDLGNCQRKRRQFGCSIITIAEAIDVLSVVLGPHHFETNLARKAQKVALMQLGLQVLNLTR